MKQMKNTDLEASITHLSYSLEKGVGSLKPYPSKYKIAPKRGLYCLAIP
jgi:hypothetical protein